MNEIVESASSSPTLWIVGGVVGAVLLYMIVKRFGNRKGGKSGGGGVGKDKRQN